MLNKAYGDSAFKLAKILVESARASNGNPLKIEIRKLFIVSEGEASRQLLAHAVVMSLKYGLKPALVDPRGTSSSHEHRFIMEKHGLDRHTASAYLIALRYLQDEKTMNNHKACEQHK